MSTPHSPLDLSTPPPDADFEMRLDRKIHDAVKYEEEKRFRQLKWITVVLGLLGVGTLGTVATYYVDRAIEARTEQLTDQAALFRFLAMANTLEQGRGLSDESRQGLFKLMRRLADNRDLRDSTDVALAVNSIFWELVNAEDVAVDQVFELFEKQILSSKSGIQAALRHYGQAMNSGLPNSASSRKKDVERFELAERRAGSRDAEELALCYRALHEFHAAGYSVDSRTMDAVGRMRALRVDDRARFFRELLLRTRATNWQSRPTPDGLEFQRRSRLFFRELSKLEGLPRDLSVTLADVGEKGCEEEECRDLANDLAAAPGAGKPLPKPAAASGPASPPARRDGTT